jgi:hypothetical protein
VRQAEAGHGDRGIDAVLEDAHEPVSLGTLDLIDAPDEVRLIVQRRPKRAHCGKGEPGVGRQDLAEHRAIVPARPDAGRVGAFRAR